MAHEIVLRHREQQKLIARNAVAELAPLWGILDFHDLKGTTADWLRAVRPVIERGILVSQYVAAEFVRNYRAAVVPHADPLDIDMPPNPLGAFADQMIQDRETQLKIMVSMQVTGPVHVARLMPLDENEAMAKGFSKSSGAAVRLILNGGRTMTVLTANADQHASGVQKVVDDNSCDTCKARAEAPVLKSEGLEAMLEVATCHDFGTCAVQPVYD